MAKLQGILISLLTAAIIAGVSGGLLIYRQVAALEVTVKNLQKEFDEETAKKQQSHHNAA